MLPSPAVLSFSQSAQWAEAFNLWLNSRSSPTPAEDKDPYMPDPLKIQVSYNIFKSLIDATHCSFILLAMRRLSRPIDVQDVVSILSLSVEKASVLLDTLVHFGFIVTVEESMVYTITPSGVDLISSKPAISPFQFDHSFGIEGDRLPTYIAFDLLPLRLYTYHLNQRSNGEEE